MVVIYTIPSSKYAQGPYQGAPLDEIEITGPPPQPVEQNTQQTESFKLNVKNQQLTAVIASITLTRIQHIAASAAANLRPAAGAGTPWTFSYTPAGDPCEALWVMQATAAPLAVGSINSF